MRGEEDWRSGSLSRGINLVSDVIFGSRIMFVLRLESVY